MAIWSWKENWISLYNAMGVAFRVWTFSFPFVTVKKGYPLLCITQDNLKEKTFWSGSGLPHCKVYEICLWGVLTPKFFSTKVCISNKHRAILVFPFSDSRRTWPIYIFLQFFQHSAKDKQQANLKTRVHLKAAWQSSALTPSLLCQRFSPQTGWQPILNHRSLSQVWKQILYILW